MNDSERTAIEKIKALRNQKGLSQSKMADLIGISQTGYAKIESAVTENIALSVAVGMAKALNVGFNELFNIDGDSQKIDELSNQIVNLNKINNDQKNIIKLYDVLYQNFVRKVLESSEIISKSFVSKIEKGLADINDDRKNSTITMFKTYNKVLQNQLVKANFISEEDIKVALNDVGTAGTAVGLVIVTELEQLE